MLDRCLRWVKTRNTRGERMFSALPLRNGHGATTPSCPKSAISGSERTAKNWGGAAHEWKLADGLIDQPASAAAPSLSAWSPR